MEIQGNNNSALIQMQDLRSDTQEWLRYTSISITEVNGINFLHLDLDIYGAELITTKEILHELVDNELDGVFIDGDTLLQRQYLEKILQQVHESGYHTWVVVSETYEQVKSENGLMQFVDVLIDSNNKYVRPAFDWIENLMKGNENESTNS